MERTEAGGATNINVFNTPLRAATCFPRAQRPRPATFTVSHDVLRLEEVTTFEGYLQRVDEIEQVQSQRAIEHGAKVKRAFQGHRMLGRPPRGAAASLDAFDLHDKVRSQVEQLFADGHYGEAVPKDLTVF